jgi:hypothetical protein
MKGVSEGNTVPCLCRNWKGDWCYNVSGNEGVKVWVDKERYAWGVKSRVFIFLFLFLFLF